MSEPLYDQRTNMITSEETFDNPAPDTIYRIVGMKIIGGQKLRCSEYLDSKEAAESARARFKTVLLVTTYRFVRGEWIDT